MNFVSLIASRKRVFFAGCLLLAGLVVFLFIYHRQGRVGHVGPLVAKKVPASRPFYSQEDDRRMFLDYGTVVPVPSDANPNVRSVAEAIKSGKNPERLTPYILPKPFDAKAYQADSEAYLQVVEPGRIWQTAQPVKGVPQLLCLGNRYRHMIQGDTVVLKVKSPANAPVTFTSFDLGAFENRLTSITVKADSRGLAQVKFTATSGTAGNANILAGCPLASEQVHFAVEIEVPRKSATVAAAEGITK